MSTQPEGTASRSSAPAGCWLWRWWLVATTAGEAAGFLVPAVAVALLPDAVGDGARLLVLVIVGAGEGALLGWAQSRVLRRVLPRFAAGAWTARTALAASVAWLIGMMPSLLWNELTRLPALLVGTLGVVLGLALLATIGVAQWTVLRSYLPGSARWIGWTALGWLAGLAVFTLVSTPLWQPGQGAVVITLIGALAGSLMALTVAAITGWGLARLLALRRLEGASDVAERSRPRW